MSAAEMQACLARLYVDEPFRKLYFLDPVNTVLDYRLTPEEAAAIRGIDRSMLEFFAGSLKTKRRKKIQGAYPLLFRLEQDETSRLYLRYYQLHPLHPNQAGDQDVIAFGEFVEASMAHAESLHPYASDVAKYERHYYAAFLYSPDIGSTLPEYAARAAVVNPDSRPCLRIGVQVGNFVHDMSAIENGLHQGEIPNTTDVQCAAYSIVFRPATDEPGVQMSRLNTASKTVLDLCDGRRTVSQVAAEAQSLFGGESLEERIVATIQRLQRLNLLVPDADSAGAANRQARAAGAATVESL